MIGTADQDRENLALACLHFDAFTTSNTCIPKGVTFNSHLGRFEIFSYGLLWTSRTPMQSFQY